MYQELGPGIGDLESGVVENEKTSTRTGIMSFRFID
jgi:hypothetical protein